MADKYRVVAFIEMISDIGGPKEDHNDICGPTGFKEFLVDEEDEAWTLLSTLPKHFEEEHKKYHG